MTCPDAFRFTCPPLLPALPHPAAAARRNTPVASLFTMLAPVSEILHAVLFTKKMSPFSFVSDPPVMENDDVPELASPDMDW